MSSSNTGEDVVNWSTGEENRLTLKIDISATQGAGFVALCFARIPKPGTIINKSTPVWKVIKTDQNGDNSYPAFEDTPGNGPDNGYNHRIDDVLNLNYYTPGA